MGVQSGSAHGLLDCVPKTGAYRFRRGIPAHLRPYFPERGVAWRENLDAKIEAEARPRCLEIAARVERLFQEAQARCDAEQAGSQAQPSTLNLEALTRLVADWKAAERSRRAQAVMVRPVMPGWPEFLREASLTGACNLKPREEETEAYMARLEARDAYVADVIRQITQARGLLIDQDHPAHAFLSQLVLMAWVEVLEAEHRC
jgi:hypothetical protein